MHTIGGTLFEVVKPPQKHEEHKTARTSSLGAKGKKMHKENLHQAMQLMTGHVILFGWIRNPFPGTTAAKNGASFETTEIEGVLL